VAKKAKRRKGEVAKRRRGEGEKVGRGEDEKIVIGSLSQAKGRWGEIEYFHPERVTY